MRRAVVSLYWSLVILGAAAVQADHIAWIDKYTGAEAKACCGWRDCMAADVTVVGETGEQTTVMIGLETMTVPSRIVRPSEDHQGKGWVCYKPQEERANGVWRILTYEDSWGRTRAVPPERFTADNVRCLFYTSLN